MKRLITERDVSEVWRDGKSEIVVSDKTIITPAAADAAAARQIRFVAPAPQPHSHSTPNQVQPQRVILGSDHGGFELKEMLRQHLETMGMNVADVGTHSRDSVDYPDFALAVAEKVASEPATLGIIVDGAGVGSAIAANKVPGIRAATCNDVYTARNSRLHNDANVLTLGSRVIGVDVAKDIVEIWLQSRFEGGRHQKRVDKIVSIETKYRRK